MTFEKKTQLLLLALSFLITLGLVRSEACCKKFNCFECDSRYDPRCGESFNLTRETGVTIPCNDFCVKLKHFFGNDYHYVRTCSSTIKEIYIKKTHVCYTTMTKDDGSLCFCDEDLCNTATSSNFYEFSNFPQRNILILIILKVLFY